MGHLRKRNEAENGLAGNLGGLREVNDGDDPTAETTPRFEVKSIFNRDRPKSRNRPPDIFRSKNAKKPAALAGRPCRFPSRHTG
jgi:hypothetical protein